MDNQLPFDLSELDRFSFGDDSFKKELISIFVNQIPVFISNMNQYLEKQEIENLAREAHTAKSSVLIFGMQNTGNMLKDIQKLAESGNTDAIPELIKKVTADMNAAFEYFSKLEI
jgi:HPt (histidine-containing phosphotransfer) domain-containing protein